MFFLFGYLDDGAPLFFVGGGFVDVDFVFSVLELEKS